MTDVKRVLENKFEMGGEIVNTIKGRRLTLEDRRVTLTNGAVAKREYVTLGSGVSIIALTKNMDVVLIAKSHASEDKTFLEVVSGGVELNESAEVAALRELNEETGYRGTTNNLYNCGECFPFPVYLKHADKVFLALDVEPGEKALEETECFETVTLTMEEVFDLFRKDMFEEGRTGYTVLKALLFKLPEVRPDLKPLIAQLIVK